MHSTPEITVLILTLNERENIEALLPAVHASMKELTVSYEIVVVDGGSTDHTAEAACALGATVIQQQEPGYANALKLGIRSTKSTYLLTLDADYSHDPELIKNLWQNRDKGAIIVGSRYIREGRSFAPWTRKVLSQILNILFRHYLSLSVRDLSSGFRLYTDREALNLDLHSKNFAVLIEILVRVSARGRKIYEVPITYLPRRIGNSHAQLLRLAVEYLKTLRTLRNTGRRKIGRIEQ